MEFRTPVKIDTPSFEIQPLEEMLFVGSCFADNIGQRFVEERFRATVNPYGTMYNPASVLHTIERYCSEREKIREKEVSGTVTDSPHRLVIFITLGPNHVYILKETGEIVDNCQKRPQRLFREEELSVDECVDYLSQVVDRLQAFCPEVHIVFTVSPIRYQKYGFHESQLSKATLQLAVDKLIRGSRTASLSSHLSALTSQLSPLSSLNYFPAYEIVLDELRDYRFYKEDMLHPTAQAVEYIWQQLVENYFSSPARQFLQEWKPIKEALGHRPFHPESEEYQRFLADVKQKETALLEKYSLL